MNARPRIAAAAGVALATVVLLAGCFGPSRDEVIDLAQRDFDSLVDQASAVDEAVLHTLEVEKPVSESCGSQTEADEKHTVFVAAGTMAIQSTGVDERELLEGFTIEKIEKGEEERWTEIRLGLMPGQRAFVDDAGITASVKIDDGLLVIAVFSPCR